MCCFNICSFLVLLKWKNILAEYGKTRMVVRSLKKAIMDVTFFRIKQKVVCIF